VTEGFRRPTWVEHRAYQQNAIKSWLDAGGRGIYNMATGTGKTVTSLLTAAEIADKLDGNLALIIAVPYQHLVDQWAEDVTDFGSDPVLAYKARRQWQERLERELLEFNMGSRSSVVVITTHTTFASDSFQNTLSRLNNDRTMLIADEVHHLGSPQHIESLPEEIQLRLGLSATPERFYDEEGTETLFEYFGDGVVFEYSLSEAIENGALVEYYYLPHVVTLTPEEAEQYDVLSAKIARLAAKQGGDIGDADLQGNTSLKHALFKRARLIGTAANKLEKLQELLEHRETIEHTLVYCGDGSVEDEMTGDTKRHVDATVDLMETELGLAVNRFTARESQSEREDLLAQFESKALDALIAIRCLDEGIDVPATKTAYVLASSSNPRQFIQRRGRILRPHPGKDHAVIHDFIVSPPEFSVGKTTSDNQFKTERRLVQKELERVNLFSEAARNHPDADVPGLPTSSGSLNELKTRYNLRQM
jgi:DNA phosphorothioation system restriction enzyme